MFLNYSSDVDRFSFFAGPPREERGNGEPDWMPGPEAVIRARADLERQGIIGAMGRKPLALRLVQPGDAPWLWLAGAGLWVVLWPALIAFRIAGGTLRWLPWWLPLVLGLLHMALLVLPVFVTQRTTGRDALRERFGRVRTLEQILALDPDDFEAWSAMLFRLMGYRVVNTRNVADHGIDLEVSSDGLPRGLVQCKRYRGTVGESAVRDLYGTMIHENAQRAWLVTTGAISRQAREWCMAKPIELWDGQTLVQQARRYS